MVLPFVVALKLRTREHFPWGGEGGVVPGVLVELLVKLLVLILILRLNGLVVVKGLPPLIEHKV